MFKNIGSVSFWTLISRIFGYLRDLVIAYFIGASIVLDAFLVAFRLPNMLRTIFGEGALSSVFIPIFSKKLEVDGKNKALSFASNICTILMLVLIPICAISIIFMPQIIGFFTPGFEKNLELFNLAVSYARITFPYIACMSLFALYGGIMNAYGKFWVFASAPVILNLVQIIAIILAPHGELAGYALAYGALLAGVFEALWVIFFAYKAGFKLSLKKPKLDADTKLLFKRIAPALVGSGITQLNVFISTIIASLIPFGISYLSYADRVYQLPLALIGTAIGIVLLPTLSKNFAKGELAKALDTQNKAVLFSSILILPIALFTAIYAVEIVAILFGYGAFNEAATRAVGAALQIFALALPAYILNKIFITTLLANGDTKTPVKIAAISLAINACVSIALLDKLSHSAVALGALCGAITSTAQLLYALYKTHKIKITSSLYINCLKIIAIQAILITALVLQHHYFHTSLLNTILGGAYAMLAIAISVLILGGTKLLKR